MRVILLCGGVNKRMSPIMRHKALLKFAGKPLIAHQIDRAKEAGLNHFVIVANPENVTDLKSAIADIPDVDTDFTVQEKPLGMADALTAASALVRQGPFIVVNPNDIFDASVYISLLSEYDKKSAYSCYLVAHQTQDYFPGGYLVVNKDNEVSHIIEKPRRGEEPSNLVNIVIHLHRESKKLLDYIAKTTSAADDVYEKALDRMIQDGSNLKAVVYTGPWQTIKYPWHVLSTMDYFLDQVTRQISPLAQISDTAVVDGSVTIEDNVKVLEGAVIRGPSYIGRDSVIGNSVLVRNSMIGDGCVIGYGTEVKHSYIGNRCWFHSNYIGDSVIDDDCSFGAGTVLANLRFDEANIIMEIGNDKVDTGYDKLGAIVGRGCRTGINASLMPGVRVGPNSFVGAHVCLAHDLEAGKKVIAEPRYRILPNEDKPVPGKRQQALKKLGN
jgi:bifunctional UDP-N-acetylglucosamine pyrophosphorylase/glucosamine-1-phosphate N-acetyltransferase